MGEYEIGKEVAGIEDRLVRVEALLEQMFRVIELNVKNKKLEEPKEEEIKK